MRTSDSYEPRPADRAPPRDLLRAGLAAIAFATAAQAQAAAYRWIDADGSVVYGDRPPTADARPLGAAGSASDSTPAAQPLPWALRTVAARQPVTLYTIADCPPCEVAREHLAQRGIPYSERSLVRDADVAAFRALGFADLRVPAITVGAERSQPFAPQAWDLLLDAAGYPTQSRLPRGWRAEPARPLAGETVAAGEPTDRGRGGASAAAQDRDAPAGAAQGAAGAPSPERAWARPEAVRPASPAASATRPSAPATGSIRF